MPLSGNDRSRRHRARLRGEHVPEMKRGPKPKTQEELNQRQRWRKLRRCSRLGCLRRKVARGLCMAHYHRAHRSNALPDNRTVAPYGTGALRPDGYRVIGNRLEHRRVVEKVLGKKLPRTAVIHHVDGNRANNRHDNLVVCPSQAYHQMLHRRTDAIRGLAWVMATSKRSE